MKKTLVLLSLILFSGQAFAHGVYFVPKQDYSTGDKPIAMNVVFVEPDSAYKIGLTFGSDNINKLMRVETLANNAGAYAAMNASYFKQDTGTPLGLTIIDGRMMTGPLMNRSVFAIDKHGKCYITKACLDGEINIGNNNSLKIKNINQPIMSSEGVHMYNRHWGSCTPVTAEGFLHIAIERNKILEISTTPVEIPETGYAVVVRSALVPCPICEDTPVKYGYSICPKELCKAEFAFAAGPNLVIDGCKNVDFAEQNFSAVFANTRTARSAIGIKQDGTVILLTVDGRQKGVSEGVTLYEVADIMLNLGACQAMNLDGGSSTQMVVEGRMVNVPTNKLGAKVTNAVVVIRK